LTVMGVILVVALIYLASAGSAKSSTVTEVTAVPASGSNPAQIQIPLSDVSSGQAKFYEYKTSSGRPVRFFVMKSSDGVYRAAADACVVCYREKKGYHQEGDDMVCNNCRKHFPSALVNEVTGGCNPDGIPRTIQGDKLLIATSDLEARKELF
ncbi:MAG TPA: DUF2318 domain-containing protein, partial [Candidatus Binatia bacterium]|nr:DUF2318 domain-containing protein [Candidatus Binatia bacterium]